MAEQDQKQPETEQQNEQAQGEIEPRGDVQNQGEAQLETAAEVAEAEAAEAEAAEAVEAVVEEPTAEDEIARLQDELVGARDDVLRAQAQAQNTKRRAEQDVEKARKFALERFTGELLPVLDNLERALEAAAGDDEVIKPIAEGVELTLKSMIGAMNKFNVETVDPQGEPFDPNLHQAMSMVENNEVEPNTVIAVMQKGYTLNGRLVRPAMVMVSKAGG